MDNKFTRERIKLSKKLAKKLMGSAAIRILEDPAPNSLKRELFLAELETEMQTRLLYGLKYTTTVKRQNILDYIFRKPHVVDLKIELAEALLENEHALEGFKTINYVRSVEIIEDGQ